MGNSVCANRVTGVIELLCLQMQKLLLYCSSAGGTLLKCECVPALSARQVHIPPSRGTFLGEFDERKAGRETGREKKM